MSDLQEIESIENLPKREQRNFLDYDKYYAVDEMLKNQYIEFENLGISVLDEVDDDEVIKRLMTEFAEYFHINISSIVNYEENELDGSIDKLGKKVYKFLCIDCYLTLIPRFLEELKIYTISEFDRYYYQTLNGNVDKFKANFVRSIQSMCKNIKQLEKLDKTIKNDSNYMELINKYEFYIKLMNFGNIENFLNNYFRPVLSKNENDIAWRIN